MRALVHLWLCVGFLLAFAQAPFLHTHAGNGHHHGNDGAAAHLHLPEAAPDQPAWREGSGDSDAQSREWLLNAGGKRVPFAAVPAHAAALADAMPPVTLAAAPTPHSHDPPGSRLLPARAPPA